MYQFESNAKFPLRKRGTVVQALAAKQRNQFRKHKNDETLTETTNHSFQEIHTHVHSLLHNVESNFKEFMSDRDNAFVADDDINMIHDRFSAVKYISDKLVAPVTSRYHHNFEKLPSSNESKSVRNENISQKPKSFSLPTTSAVVAEAKTPQFEDPSSMKQHKAADYKYDASESVEDSKGGEESKEHEVSDTNDEGSTSNDLESSDGESCYSSSSFVSEEEES